MPHLTLSRSANDRLYIYDDDTGDLIITITVADIARNQVRLVFDADLRYQIVRDNIKMNAQGVQVNKPKRKRIWKP